MYVHSSAMSILCQVIYVHSSAMSILCQVIYVCTLQCHVYTVSGDLCTLQCHVFIQDGGERSIVMGPAATSLINAEAVQQNFGQSRSLY